MNKITKAALALTTCLAASSASADTIYGIYAGVQGWNMDAKGSFGQVTNGVSSSANFNFDKESQSSFYLAIEHPIPLLPNVKVKRNSMETTGNSTLNGTFVFGGETFSITSQLNTVVDLSNTDYILYYELLDSDLATIDFGINAKNIDGVLNVVSKNNPTQTARETFDGFVPMLYGNIEFGLPFTGFGVFAEGSMLSVGDHSLYDYEAGIGYTFLDNAVVDLTVQLGYRAVKLELDDLEDINSNLEFDGVFVGFEVHF
jgi:outer membrane protein